MPGKSGRGQGKQLSRSKRKKGRQGFATTPAPPQVVAPSYKPDAFQKVPSPAVSEPAPAVSATVPKASPTLVRYPLITAELKRIGILAVIMVVILVILAVALP